MLLHETLSSFILQLLFSYCIRFGLWYIYFYLYSYIYIYLYFVFPKLC